MIAVSHYADADTLAGFTLQFRRNLLADCSDLITHKNVGGFERFSLLKQRVYLDIQL